MAGVEQGAHQREDVGDGRRGPRLGVDGQKPEGLHVGVEAGHFLGLAHTPELTAVMYARYNSGTTALTSDDVTGICAIYAPGGARAHEPHRIAFYLYELASEFHGAWNRGIDLPQLRFIREDDKATTAARLALTAATRAVLAAGLGILGVFAPEEMR